MAPRPHRRSVPSADPQPPLVDALPDPLTDPVIEALRDLVSSPGWVWLQQRANAEFGSAATVMRLASFQTQNLPPDQFGLHVNATLAARQAVERLLNLPAQHINTVQVERARRKAMEGEA